MQRVEFSGGRWKLSDSCRHDDFPHVAPFLAVENFFSAPVHSPAFCFSQAATSNIFFIQEMKSTLLRLDILISRNKLDKHPCLISQAGSQSTMRLASKVQLRGDWNTSVEIPFCLHVTENGICPREFDHDELFKQAQWLDILEEVLLPLDKMNDTNLSKIAPDQHDDVVRNALIKSKREKKQKYSKIPGKESSSSGYSSL
ncbi:unnamed protein product [Caenorhabditis sp. 36 PRJEB53466]|nr:unnamed protein product [Caenorhabditis sp. 36 PRJEB53466]